MKKIDYFTDGACNNNKSGGWAFYCPQQSLRVCGYKNNTTNNEMELVAIAKVIKYIIHSNESEVEIYIHSDSAWAIGAITNDWNLKHHQKLIEAIKKCIQNLASKRKIFINFAKVQGHSNIEGNEICDTLAVIMSKYGSN